MNNMILENIIIFDAFINNFVNEAKMGAARPRKHFAFDLTANGSISGTAKISYLYC